MNTDRRTLLGGAMLAAALSTAAKAQTAQAPADSTEIIPLWPNGAPGGEKVTVKEEILDRTTPGGLKDRAIAHTRNPTLTVFRPEKPNGAAFVTFPGGAYVRATLDKEGYDVARWMAARGYTAFVCAYRFPGDGWAAGPNAPLQDAQRTMRVIRSRAAAMGFSPNRISAQGFSAGGHLAASLLTRFDEKVYEPVDAADSFSARPDLGCLMYPVISFTPGLMHEGSRRQMIGANPSVEEINRYSTEMHVTAQTPPTFMCHAADDSAVPPGNSIAFFTALRAVRVAAEMHIFEEGGHGFGMRGLEAKTVRQWPELFHAFSAKHGV